MGIAKLSWCSSDDAPYRMNTATSASISVTFRCETACETAARAACVLASLSPKACVHASRPSSSPPTDGCDDG